MCRFLCPIECLTPQLTVCALDLRSEQAKQHKKKKKTEAPAFVFESAMRPSIAFVSFFSIVCFLLLTSSHHIAISSAANPQETSCCCFFFFDLSVCV